MSDCDGTNSLVPGYIEIVEVITETKVVTKKYVVAANGLEPSVPVELPVTEIPIFTNGSSTVPITVEAEVVPSTKTRLKRRSLRDSDYQDIMRRYNAGESVVSIAKLYGTKADSLNSTIEDIKSGRNVRWNRMQSKKNKSSGKV